MFNKWIKLMRIWVLVLSFSGYALATQAPIPTQTTDKVLNNVPNSLSQNFKNFEFTETNYPIQKKTLLQFFKNLGTGFFLGKDKIKISYAFYQGKTKDKAIVISPGRTEASIKYAELIYNLSELGFTIYVIDHRGQGFSGRMMADVEIGHVEKFADYVEDLSTFITTVVQAQGYKSYILLAHSMGGAIAGMYAEKKPPGLEKLILSAPMFKIKMFLNQRVASGVLNVNSKLGNANKYVPTTSKYDPNYPFENNSVTHSLFRFNFSKDLCEIYPEIKLGGPSNQWLNESIIATEKIRHNADKITVPVIIFSAEQDIIVDNSGQQEFCKIAKHCELKSVVGARHEILQEIDSIRTPVINEIIKLINRT